MTDAPCRSNRPSRGGLVLRALAAVVCLVAGASGAMGSTAALSSRLSADPAADPHGYALIFGTVLALIAWLIVALTAPLAFRAERRGRVLAIAMIGFTAIGTTLVVALVTA
jgi:hypothetical protein